LTVLNNSKVTGLAKKAAADFAAKGWTIAGTGNLSGRLSRTTVYYPAGMLAAAVELRRAFPAVADSAPRYAGLPGDGTLVVVVTRDYPH
jgi:ribulose-5-phosphate 4-epimerase/fuculose-1-phosphate aldolase